MKITDYTSQGLWIFFKGMLSHPFLINEANVRGFPQQHAI